ncbi:hypothetical protein L1049_028506 [Liquidambar formosana]|uniref:RING-type domain-containing protein n=1 Tax=Liquidambar formosana TaxID=63359 RepID=A0AAP0RJS8_LIQFO
MVMEIVISVILLFVGIAVLVVIHICVVGRAFSRGYTTGAIVQRSSSIVSPKMSHNDLEKLPCFEYNAGDIGNYSTLVDCAVCLENFKVGDKCRLLPNCSHCFHPQCIDSWLLKTSLCPICRTCANPLKIEVLSGGESSVSSDAGVELT